MKKCFIKNTLVLLAIFFVHAGIALGEAREEPLLIVHRGDWGNAGLKDIQALLQNVQRNFFSNIEEPPLQDIQVYRKKNGPMVAFRDRPADPYKVYLDVSGRYWAQFSYQYAHELCHIIMGHDRLKGSEGKSHPFNWLHESICETASLYTLRRMAEDWKTRAPYPNWVDYGKHLTKYARDRLDKPAHQLPEGLQLRDWYAANRFVLEANGTLRPLNNVIALRLLPLFEKHPSGWEAVRYMPKDPGSLKAYLQAWLDQAPPEKTKVIHAIAGEFGIQL